MTENNGPVGVTRRRLLAGPSPDTNITGNRSYTRAHFLYYAGVVQPGAHR
jgi:hypothetical protein